LNRYLSKTKNRGKVGPVSNHRLQTKRETSNEPHYFLFSKKGGREEDLVSIPIPSSRGRGDRTPERADRVLCNNKKGGKNEKNTLNYYQKKR